jgi:hypothetical protein
MAQKNATPGLTAREYKDGRGWYVEAATEGGMTENVGDFASAPGAQDWIDKKAAAYFKTRGKLR